MLTVILLMSVLPSYAFADVIKVFSVSTAQELSDACAEINNSNGGEYTISLTADITDGNIGITNSTAEVTVIGNGYSISATQQIVHVENGAKVHLGDGITSLTLKGAEYNDVPGIVYVLYDSFCDMRDKVTIKDRKGQNYLGGGVSIEGGTFRMYGGTIDNCGIDGGSVCYGGGVAVYNGGSFTMDNGTIKNCYVTNSNGSDYGWQVPNTAGGGVFVCRASFTMNGGIIENCRSENTELDNIANPDAVGGGVAVITSLDSVYDNGKYGFVDSDFTMNSGTIKNCSATMCGGALVAGLAYIHNEAICTSYKYVSGSENPGIYLTGGTITENEANDGGAIFLNWIRQSIPVSIKDMMITSNKAYNGAGIEIKSYWTQTTIDGCMITGNIADSVGGGIYLNQTLIDNKYPCQTYLMNSTISNNTSGEIGAGIYYNSASNLMISGSNTIQNNTYNGKLNNLNILSKDYPVYVTGVLTGSQIGLSDPTLWDDGKEDIAADAVSTEYLTSGYKENNTEVHPSEYFTSDHESWIVDRSTATTISVSDPNSNEYRKYNAKRYAVTSSGNDPYGQVGDYFYYHSNSDEMITSLDDIFNALVAAYSPLAVSTVTDVAQFKRYNTSDGTQVTIQKNSTVSNNNVTLSFSKNKKSVTFTASPTYQQSYANNGEIVFNVSSKGAFSNLEDYVFSTQGTETTIDYVNASPTSNIIYEYNNLGIVTAKIELVDGIDTYELIQPTTTNTTGTNDEVRLVRAPINYHINNADIVAAKYDDHDDSTDDDIFTSYVEAEIGKDVKVGETIEKFWTVPEVTPTAENSCPYIFKGWYYDRDNSNDTHPVVFGTDKYSKDIFAHWIKVDDITPDPDDPYTLPDEETSYGGFDLAGVQVRLERTKDTNFGGRLMPGGLRFLTSLSTDVVDQINAIKPNNIEYGYVATTNEDWIKYHNYYGRKLLYVSETANGINTSTTDDDACYFGFAKNINCTSKRANPKTFAVREDHLNFNGYLLYTLVITYEDAEESDYDKDVLARPYIRYTDANGSERVAYSEYRGTSNVMGGCKTSYNKVK